MSMEKIFWTPTSLSAQFPKQIDNDKCYIELLDNHLIWRGKYTADEPVSEYDPNLGLQLITSDFKIFVFKKSVSGMEVSLIKNGKRWRFDIMLTGFSEDIKIYFKTEKEAENMYNKVFNWLMN